MADKSKPADVLEAAKGAAEGPFFISASLPGIEVPEEDQSVESKPKAKAGKKPLSDADVRIGEAYLGHS